MSKSKLKVVNTEPESPLEALWRMFPQVQNSTMVDRMSWAGEGDDNGVVRTFRLLDGQYLRIRATSNKGKARIEALPVPVDEADIYEWAWEELGSRAIDHDREDRPHGIMHTSFEFDQLVDETMEQEQVGFYSK